MNPASSSDKLLKALNSKEDYTALLLLHAAHADLEYTSEERSKILELVPEHILIENEEFYNRHTDYHILNLLTAHRKTYFPTDESRDRLLHSIKELFGADGKYSKLESGLLHFLNHML